MYLSKELMSIAGRSLKANITTLSPLVLPWSEQMAYAANMFARKVDHLQSALAEITADVQHDVAAQRA